MPPAVRQRRTAGFTTQRHREAFVEKKYAEKKWCREVPEDQPSLEKPVEPTSRRLPPGMTSTRTESVVTKAEPEVEEAQEDTVDDDFEDLLMLDPTPVDKSWDPYGSEPTLDSWDPFGSSGTTSVDDIFGLQTQPVQTASANTGNVGGMMQPKTSGMMQSQASGMMQPMQGGCYSQGNQGNIHSALMQQAQMQQAQMQQAQMGYMQQGMMRPTNCMQPAPGGAANYMQQQQQQSPQGMYSMNTSHMPGHAKMTGKIGPSISPSKSPIVPEDKRSSGFNSLLSDFRM